MKRDPRKNGKYKSAAPNLQEIYFRKCIYLCLQILPIMNYISNNKFVGNRLIIVNFAISLKTWSIFELIFLRIFVTFSNSFFFNLIKRFFFWNFGINYIINSF